MKTSSTPPTGSRVHVFVFHGLTILLLGAIAWISYLNIPIVTNIDATFTHFAGYPSDTTEILRLSDHASASGAVLVRYQVVFTALAVGVPMAALGAMLLRPARRVAVLCLLFGAGFGIHIFCLFAIVAST